MDKNISTTWFVNYDSKMHTMDSKSSGSFSVRIRGVERTIVDASVGFKSEIPHAFLADEETCSRYMADVLTKARMHKWHQQHIIPKICKDVIDTSCRLGEEGKKGFLVEAQVQVVKETLMNNWLCSRDYDSEGCLIPIEEQECKICLEELASDGQTNIMKLSCSHCFHKDCLLMWLRSKHSCPTCQDDVQDPRPWKKIPRMIDLSKERIKKN